MKKINVIRAWKDKDYKDSLTPEELALLPESPIELLQDDLSKIIVGGTSYGNINTVSLECWGFCCSVSQGGGGPATNGAYTCHTVFNGSSYC